MTSRLQMVKLVTVKELGKVLYWGEEIFGSGDDKFCYICCGVLQRFCASRF